MRWSVVVQDLARESGGVIDRRLAALNGVPEVVLDKELRLGRLVAMHPGVYRPPAVAPDLSVRQRAAVLAAGVDAALSHRTAAGITELCATRGYERVDVLIPHHRRVRLAGVDVHRTLHLPNAHVREVDGMRVTTVDRTLADLGAVVSATAVAICVERAVIDRRTTVARLYRFIDDHGARGRSGIGALRAALDAWMLGERPPDSALEVAFARLIARADLPVPCYQYELLDGRRFIARVDAAWPDRRVIVEVDGLHHHSTASAFTHDLRRQNELVRLGWTVLRFDWPRVVRRPAGVVAELAQILAHPPRSRESGQ